MAYSLWLMTYGVWPIAYVFLFYLYAISDQPYATSGRGNELGLHNSHHSDTNCLTRLGE
jgi:hypothetical protein